MTSLPFFKFEAILILFSNFDLTFKFHSYIPLTHADPSLMDNRSHGSSFLLFFHAACKVLFEVNHSVLIECLACKSLHDSSKTKLTFNTPPSLSSSSSSCLVSLVVTSPSSQTVISGSPGSTLW